MSTEEERKWLCRSMPWNMAIESSIPLSRKQMSRGISQALMWNPDTGVLKLLLKLKDKQEILMKKKQCWIEKEETCFPH